MALSENCPKSTDKSFGFPPRMAIDWGMIFRSAVAHATGSLQNKWCFQGSDCQGWIWADGTDFGDLDSNQYHVNTVQNQYPILRSKIRYFPILHI